MGHSRYDRPMKNADVEDLATQALLRARLLTHRVEEASNAAIYQAVLLLHDQGMSQRKIAKLTGLSKSDVARRIGPTRSPDTPNKHDVQTFSEEWIWGSREAVQYVDDFIREMGEGRSLEEPDD